MADKQDDSSTATSEVLNNFAYFALPDKTVAIGSVALGEGATERAFGTSQLLNDLFDTRFEVGRRSFLTYGCADLDTGATFDPVRHMAIIDSHGKLDPAFYPLLAGCAVLLVHVDARELQTTKNVDSSHLHKEFAELRAAAVASGAHVFVLLRDCDCLTEDAETPSGSILEVANCAERYPALAPLADTKCDVVVLPDLRDGDNIAAAEAKFATLRPAVLGAVDVQVKALLATESNNDISRLGSVGGKRAETTGKSKKKKKGKNPYVGGSGGAKSGEQVVIIFTKQTFLDGWQAVVDGMDGDAVDARSEQERFQRMHDQVESFVQDLVPFQEDFFHQGAVPVRNLLRKLRSVEKRAMDPNLPDEAKAARAERDVLMEELKNTEPSPLLQKFLALLNEADAVTIMTVLAERVKTFVQGNTRDALTKRKQLRRNKRDISNAVEHRKALQDINETIDMKTLSLEVLFRELSFLCQYTEKFAFSVKEDSDVEQREPAGEASLLDRALSTFGGALFGNASASSGGAAMATETIINPISPLQRFIAAGEPFELIDGDNLKFPGKLLERLFGSSFMEKKRVFVMSVLGPQSSGKSTLLNSMFGSKFGTGTGRCTKVDFF